MVRKAKRGPKRASKRGVVKSNSKGKGAKKYLAENWASILLLVVIIVLLIVGIVYSQKSCRRNRMENMENSTSSNPAFVIFYAEWCGHCKTLKPIIKLLQEKTPPKNKKGTSVDIIMINAEKKKELSQQHDVKGYPTIKYLPNGLKGGNGINYNGARTEQAIIEFIKNQ
jgi:thiol-disulfide isomerase/thioredoxin